MQDMPEQAELLVGLLPIYYCNLCEQPAEHPVLPPCGHLHCWKCIHQAEECSLCSQPLNQDLFALFVDHGELEAEGLPLPPKPKPRYSQRIRNSGGIQGEAGTMRFQDNHAQGVGLSGLGFFPPLAVNSWSNCGQLSEDQDLIGKLPFRLLWIMLVLLIVAILWFT